MSDQVTLHRIEDKFGKLMVPLMHDKTVTDGACRLYAHMHWRAGVQAIRKNVPTFEGQASMAEFMDVNENTIGSRIKELEARDWVVVVLRFDSSKGEWLIPHYHIFEDQQLARDFRQNYQPKSNERIREKPTEVSFRKSRKGIGGNPKLKHRSNSSLDGSHSNSSWDGRPNSSWDGRPNSSWDNLDSLHLDSIDPDSLKEIQTATNEHLDQLRQQAYMAGRFDLVRFFNSIHFHREMHRIFEDAPVIQWRVFMIVFKLACATALADAERDEQLAAERAAEEKAAAEAAAAAQKAADDKALAEIIDGWLKGLAGKPAEDPFKNKTYRQWALDLHRDGFTPAIVKKYVETLREQNFWKGRLIPFKQVADNIRSWYAENNPTRSDVPTTPARQQQNQQGPYKQQIEQMREQNGLRRMPGAQ